MDVEMVWKYGKMVAVYFVMIWKWSEVLRHWMMWRECTNKS